MMDPDELENLENIEDFETGDEDFEDTPKSRGDILDTDEDEFEDPPDEVDTDEDSDEDPEPEEPSEEEPETEELPEPEVKAEKDPKANVRVPIARLDAEIARRKEAEEKLAKLGERDRAAEKQTSRMGEISSRMEELDELMAKATLEGDDKTFRKLRAEERQLNTELMDMRLRESTQAAISQTRFDATLDLVESKYPQLNPDSDKFDQALTDEVTELMEAFQAKGHAPHVALKRAVSYVIRDVPEEVLSEPEPEKPKGLRKQPRSTDTPKERNQKAKKAIPPTTAGRRAASEKTKSVWQMSDEEFDRWVDSKEGREARGDFLN